MTGKSSTRQSEPHQAGLNMRANLHKKDSSAQEFHGLFTESFQAVGNELSVLAWTLRKLMLSYICGCLYTEFISQTWKLSQSAWELRVNKECKRLCTTFARAVNYQPSATPIICLQCGCVRL